MLNLDSKAFLVRGYICIRYADRRSLCSFLINSYFSSILFFFQYRIIKYSMKTFSSYMQNLPPYPHAGVPGNLKYMSDIIADVVQLYETKCRNNQDAAIAEAYIKHKDFLIKSLVVITNNLSDSSFDIEQFATDMSISKSTLNRRLNILTGSSPCELTLYIKMRYAQLLLADLSLQISEIADKLGFNCPKYFSNCFRRRFGVTPTEYREEIAEMQTGKLKLSRDKLFIQKATKIIENNILNTSYRFSLLAQELGLSKSTLYRRIKEITGLSPVKFMRSVKLNHAKVLLRRRSGDLLDIAYASGFSDAKYFCRCFRNEFGVLPKEVINL